MSRVACPESTRLAIVRLRLPALGVVAVVAMLAICGCGPLAATIPTATGTGPSAESAPPSETPTGLDAIRESRLRLGLRADYDWILTVEADPLAVLRYGIKVTADEAAQLDERLLASELELREELGFSTDPAWVRKVLADPMSVDGPQEVRLSRAEFAAWKRRDERERSVRRAFAWYAPQHRDQWAGWYEEAEGDVVALFTGDLDAHHAALAALIPADTAAVDVRHAQRSMEALESKLELVDTEVRAWVEDQGLSMWRSDIDVPNNRLTTLIRLPKPDPTLESRLLDEFDAHDWLTVGSEVNHASTLERGRLVVQAVDALGRPVPELTCVLIPDIPGAAGEGNEVQVANEKGVCGWRAQPVGATGYRVQVWDRFDGRLLGSGRVVVPANGEVELTVRVIGA